MNLTVISGILCFIVLAYFVFALVLSSLFMSSASSLILIVNSTTYLIFIIPFGYATYKTLIKKEPLSRIQIVALILIFVLMVVGFPISARYLLLR